MNDAGPSPARRETSAVFADLVAWLRGATGLTYQEIGCLAGVSARTVRRWADPDHVTVPNPKHRPTLETLHEMRRLLSATFPCEDAILMWMHREVPLLEGRRPVDLIRRCELEPVLGVLAGMNAGSFA